MSLNNLSSASKWTSNAQCDVTDESIGIVSNLRRTHRILFAPWMLEESREELRAIFGAAPCLLVTTPTVHALYADKLSAMLERSGAIYRLLVLDCTEGSKDFSQVLRVCEEAMAMHLRRGSSIVAVGGGVCLDIVGLASSIYRRGVGHVKIPTTLIGLIDAGVGIKNGINHHGKKSILGSFYPPAVTLICRTFLRTLSLDQIRDGLSEALKIAVISDPHLVGLIEKNAAVLMASRLQDGGGEEIVRRSISGMIGELSQNLYELDSYRRAVDLGHTFSPYIESATDYAISHGRAVSIDMAISAAISAMLGEMEWNECDRILRILESCGLPTMLPEGVDIAGLHASLASVVAHRDGALNLVIPTSSSGTDFIEDPSVITEQLIESAVSFLRSRPCKESEWRSGA